MTYDELVKALKRAEYLLKPNAIICNPQYADTIKKEFGEEYKVIVSDLVEPDKIYVVDRKRLEEV